MSRTFGRRTMLELGAASVAALCLPKPAHALRPARPLPFPKGFLWGVATSAYQIEGAVKADGRGPSIWDTFAHTPGKIHNGDNGDVAVDHYHRYREDVALMKELGGRAYRFSIAWPRILPEGVGKPNDKGLDFYQRLVDALLEAGITPYATLYHWDLPQALEDKGGWQSRDTAVAFADYAALVSGKLSDRVKSFFTINEIATFVELGYGGSGDSDAVHAPGLKLTRAQRNQVRHHAVLAQGLSIQAIRGSARKGTRCGPAENVMIAVPALDSPEHVKAAELATRSLNAGYMTVMLEGAYLPSWLEQQGKDAPKYTQDELRAIGTKPDFVGLNVYRPHSYVIASDQPSGYQDVPISPSHPRMFSSWQVVGPEVMYWAARQVPTLWKVKDLYITENGNGAADSVARDGKVYDSDRIMLTRASLTYLQRAVAEGSPVRGYFHWSLLDNFEWHDGYRTRFGLVYVDFATQKRTPKLSASWLRETARRNAVL